MLSHKDRDNVEDQTWPRKKTKMQMQWLWDGKVERLAAINSRPSNGKKSPARPPKLDGRENEQVKKSRIRPFEGNRGKRVPQGCGFHPDSHGRKLEERTNLNR